jgi:hypothetical protein
VTLQVLVDSVQVVELKVPVLLVVNVTVPVGVPELDVTVAVQLEAVLSSTLAGAHETAVVVAVTPWVAASRNVPLLPVWTLSPP